MFDVNKFLNAMSMDGARPNLFDIHFPSIDSSGNSFRFKARATAIPSSSVGITPVNYFGRQVKLAGNRIFDNWTVTVMLDESDLKAPTGIRYILEQWSHEVNNHVGNKRSSNSSAPLSYMKTAIINHYRKDGQLNAMYSMVNCWPVDIGPINLDWALDNQIAEFNATFAMQYWTSEATDR